MLEEAQVQCPHCWQPISVTLDLSAGSQRYVEDCPVCCRPLLLSLETDGEAFAVEVRPEND